MYSVSTISVGLLPGAAPLATYDAKRRDLSLWPGGVGVGPRISLSLDDWISLKHSADEAIRSAMLRDYTAREGVDFEEESL